MEGMLFLMETGSALVWRLSSLRTWAGWQPWRIKHGVHIGNLEEAGCQCRWSDQNVPKPNFTQLQYTPIIVQWIL